VDQILIVLLEGNINISCAATSKFFVKSKKPRGCGEGYDLFQGYIWQVALHRRECLCGRYRQSKNQLKRLHLTAMTPLFISSSS
jgi:hypothetical protein